MDEDIRALERRMAAGDDDAVEPLQRAYQRSGDELRYLNLVLTTKLDRAYRDPERGRLRAAGGSIYEIAETLYWLYGPIDGYRFGPENWPPPVSINDRDSRYESTAPFFFIVVNRERECCVGIERSHGYHYREDTPDSYWPMLAPWVPPTESGMKGRHGRVLAFVKNPPKGVFKYSFRALYDWALAKRNTGAWNVQPGLTLSSVNGVREAIFERIVGDRRYLYTDSVDHWLMLACELFLERQINACVEGRPDLKPLARLLNLHWPLWFDTKLEEARQIYRPATKELDPAVVQQLVRSDLGIPAAKLPDWTPPMKAAPYHYDPKHQRQFDPPPVMPNAHRKHRKYR